MAKKQAINKMSFDFDIDSDKAFDELQKDAAEHIEQNVDFSSLDEQEEDENSFTYDLDEDGDDDNVVDEDEDVEQDSAPEEKNKAVKTNKASTQVQQQTEEDETENQQKVFGDRANKRIRELNAQKKQAQLEAETIRKEKFEAEKQIIQTRKELLTLKVDKLKRDYEQAINDGEVSKQVELNTELAKIGADLSNIEQQEVKYKEYKPAESTSSQQDGDSSGDVFGIDFDQTKAAKLASDWEFDNPRVLTDPMFNKTSLEIGRRLMDRGYRPDSEEFYSELTRRVRMAYGQQVDQPSEQKKQEQQQDVADVVVVKKSPPKMQTVAGASRTPSPTAMNGQATGKNVVRISREGLELAKEFGVDPRTYAKNYSRVEKAMNAKGQIKVDLFDE